MDLLVNSILFNATPLTSYLTIITNFYKNQWAQGRCRYLLIGSDLPDISDFAFI